MQYSIIKTSVLAGLTILLLNACGVGSDASYDMGAAYPLAGEAQDQAGSDLYDFEDAGENSVSTFSIDVDTASYSIARSNIEHGFLPAPESVRLEEFVNYFEYEYAPPSTEVAFAVHTEVGSAPWNENNRLLKIGIKGKVIETESRGNTNLVFLIDTSGSMSASNKLPLLKESLNMLVDQLTSDDRIAIVTYAGSAGVALESTTGDQKDLIKQAINNLQSAGSTNGEAGISLAYNIASANFQTDGVNRVLLATDGDFNVGQTSADALVELINNKAEGGIFLTTLGFGMYGNDYMLEKLADKGNGNYAYIDTLQEAKKALVDNINSTLIAIAKDVKIQLNFDQSFVAQYRLLGYENRRLNNEDFEDDSKDAGEIGAGHTVTAFYEIVLQPEVAEASGENLATLSLRYKEPDQNQSQLIESSIPDNGNVSQDFLFAASVAEFALILQNSPYKANASYDNVLLLAENNKGTDLHGYRQAYIDLVNKAKLLN